MTHTKGNMSDDLSDCGSTDVTLLPNEGCDYVVEEIQTTYDDKSRLDECKKSDYLLSHSDEKDRNTRVFNAGSIMLIFIINFANFVNGIYMAAPGPTLLFLADRVSSGVGLVSTILAGRSAGNLLGAFAATVISKRRMRYWDATMRLGISFIAYGMSTLSIPFVTDLWALIAVLSVGGFLFGFTNTGFLAVQLDIWGEKKSRPLMQLYQAVFSIGAMLAPLIASPFLEMAAESQYKKPNVPSCLKANSSHLPVSYENGTSTEFARIPSDTAINPVTWVYVIIGALHLLVAAAMIIMSLSSVEDRARCHHHVASEAREEEPICRVAPLLVCVIAFYASQVAAINVFASYIYSVSYCSKLEFSISKASSINSLYWGVFIVGRVTALFVSSKTKPSTMITSCVFMLMTSAALMSARGEKSEWVSWVATTLWALAVSPLFGSGVSWVSRITNVSGRYAVIFEIGSAIGAVGAFPVAGILFEMDPYSVIHFVSGLIGLLTLSYAGMLVTSRKHFQRSNETLEQNLD